MPILENKSHPTVQFMTFLIVFLLIIIGLHTYIYWHVWTMLPFSSIWRTVILSLMTLSFACLFLYLSPVEDKMPMWLAKMVYETGTTWVIIFLYLFIIFLLLDISHLCHLIPRSVTKSSVPFSLGITLFIALLLFCGNVRYHHKYKREFDIKTSKPLKHPYKILMCSDLHLGYSNQREEFHRWVELMNEEQPDIILICGDIIDGNIRPLNEEKMWEEFKMFKAPVYACLGNHEFISGKQSSEEFYKQAGIRLLEDEVITDGDLCIIGRDDRSNPKRKQLKDLANQADSRKFTILLDHQPYNLEETAQHHIDLQLSGHTHHGQIWPINWITDLVYECSYGYYEKGNTKYYVSSGLGIWGGKYRICTTSEYVVINVEK